MEMRTFFEIPGDDCRYNLSRNYVLQRVRNPDPGSEFDNKTREIMGHPDSEVIDALEAGGYDMMLGYEGNEICGHLAFQRHEDGLHVFSVALDKAYGDGRNLWNLTKGFLEQVRAGGEAKRVRISKGGNKHMEILLGLLKKKEGKLGIRVDTENYWVELVQ